MIFELSAPSYYEFLFLFFNFRGKYTTNNQICVCVNALKISEFTHKMPVFHNVLQRIYNKFVRIILFVQLIVPPLRFLQ